MALKIFKTGASVFFPSEQKEFSCDMYVDSLNGEVKLNLARIGKESDGSDKNLTSLLALDLVEDNILYGKIEDFVLEQNLVEHALEWYPAIARLIEERGKVKITSQKLNRVESSL